ncbi:putative flowering time control protein FCA-like isoform X1 [Capsicum annuum]|nr:putative flowering time control protein FCA-like isoform X1 [Capsicum annuum]KAF3680697.1 putative flowering time control protein FCA-like isoform X1 [Capsicum annuum]
MNNLERSWMYERLDGRGCLYSRFITGVDEFIQFACSQPNRMSGDKVRCPCAKCQNYKFMDVETVKCHLYQSGFIENYFIWKHQGERDDISETSYGNALHGGGQPVFVENPYRQIILDAAGPNFSQGSSWQSYSNSEPESSHPFQHSMEEDPNLVSKKFYDLLDAVDAELYLDSSLSQLAVVSRMLNIKMENNMSQRGYNQMMQFLKESLPEDNIVLDNYYQTKKLVRSLGLPVEKIDCCESGCMLYWGDDDKHVTSCKFCSKPRYKHCVGSRKKKLVPYKRMNYFSLILRLQRLYASHATAADIRWHHEHKKKMV